MGQKVDAFLVAFGVSFKRPLSQNSSAKVLNFGKLAMSVPIISVVFSILALRSMKEPGRRLIAVRGFIYGFGLVPIGIAIDLFASMTFQIHNAVSRKRIYKRIH